MSLTGEVQTLYKDREKTRPVFPTTKTKAISDDNGVGLDAILEKVLFVGEDKPEGDTAPLDADTLGGRPASDFATENFVVAKIAEAQMEGSDVDLSGYATKDDVANAVSAIDFPVDSVNGKTGAVSLSASDVGAAPSSHNHSASDITSGTLAVARGGTGKATHTGNAVLTGNGTSAVNNVATANGAFYATAANGAPKFGTLPIAQGGTGATSAANARTKLVVAEAKPDTTYKSCYYRTVDSATEWINPPLIPGKEYRTTERRNGQVVYTKLIEIGALPNNTRKDVSVGVSASKVFRTEVSAYNYSAEAHSMLPYTNSSGEVCGYIIWGTDISISSNSNFSAYSAYVQLWYVK